MQSDENEDNNGDSQNGDQENSKNKLNTECKGKSTKYLFNLTLVNSYGSADIQALQDNDKPLKITG